MPSQRTINQLVWTQTIVAVIKQTQIMVTTTLLNDAPIAAAVHD